MKTKQALQKQSDNLLLEQVKTITADEVVDAIATSIPGINIAYKLAKAYFGRGLKLRQHRALEWVEFVRDNLGEFSKQQFDNEQFQDCFVLLTEANIKERAKHKRQLHQKILLGLTKLSDEDLEKFELEKMIMVTNQISFAALNVLSFIKNELLSVIKMDIKEQLKVYKERNGVEGIRLEDVTRRRILVSEYIDKWIHERYGLNSDVAKKRHDYTKNSPIALRNKITYERHLKERELLGPLPELANLGLLIRKNGTAAFGGSVGTGYSLTDFGYRFIDNIES